MTIDDLIFDVRRLPSRRWKTDHKPPVVHFGVLVPEDALKSLLAEIDRLRAEVERLKACVVGAEGVATMMEAELAARPGTRSD